MWALLNCSLLKTGDLKGFEVGGRRLWRIGVVDVDEYIADAGRRTAARVAGGKIQNDEPRASMMPDSFTSNAE